MALWMEPGSEPQTLDEITSLAAISALKLESAIELKEKGNEYLKKGKKHYSDAIDCYNRAINQKALNDSESSLLYSNRAHVNLLLGNFRRALQDADEAIRLSPTNVKAFYRAVKASLALNLLDEAKSYCEKGITLTQDNEDLKKLRKQIDAKILEDERRKTEVSNALAVAKGLVSAFEGRRVKIGKAMYQELTGVRKPVLDKCNILHWPVLLIYPEVMSTDFIEEFCETDMFSVHFDLMFSDSSPPLPWDTKQSYTRDAIELYYEAYSGVGLSKKEILRYLLNGTAASHLENFDGEETDSAPNSVANGNGPKWVRVNERRTLYDILKSPDIIVPGIVVFFVISKKSSFYKDFTSGNWSMPNML